MLREKNQNLLNELSSATAAKQRVQRTKKWVLFLLLATVAIFYFTSNIYARSIATTFTVFSIFIHVQARQLADQVNLKEKFSIGKRVGEADNDVPVNTDDLFTSSKKTKSTATSTKEAPKVTTNSPFATNSSLRNRKLAAQNPDFEEEKTSFDPSAAEKLLPLPQEPNDSIRQSALFDSNASPVPGNTSRGVFSNLVGAAGGNLRAMLNSSNLFASPSAASAKTQSQMGGGLGGGAAIGGGLYGYGNTTSMKQSSADSPSHHVYHLSPLNTGAVKGPKPPAANKVKDALQVLEMRQLPELWVERLREMLGKDLTRIMKLYDESITTMIDVMRNVGTLPAGDLQKAILLLEFRSLTGKEVLPSNPSITLTLDDVIKFVQRVGISNEVLSKFEQTVSFLRLCQWMIELRKNHTSGSSFSATAGGGRGNVDLSLASFLQGGTAGNVSGLGSHQDKHRKLTPLIDRLRMMALESSDFGLRIHWSHMDMNEVILSGRVEHEILDQEVAMALYLHRCDSIASVRAALPTHIPDARFSRTHYAYSLRDVHQRIRPVLVNQAEASFSLSGSKSHAHSSGVQTVLLQRTLADVASSSGERDRADSISGAEAMMGMYGVGGGSLSLPKPPHYDILRLALDGHSGVGGIGSVGLGALEEILTIDVSRHDVFESILVFMLVIYFSSHTLSSSSSTSSVSTAGTTDSEGDDISLSSSPTSDDDGSGRKSSSSASSSFTGSGDYRVIQPIIEDIAGREELLQLIDAQRTAIRARMKQQAMMRNQQSAEKIISSGFGFGLGLSYPSPGGVGGSAGVGVGRMNVSPQHYHHHHQHLHMSSNLAVPSQIRMPTNHHSPSSSTSMPTSSMSASMSNAMPSTMFRPNNNLRQSNILPAGNGVGGGMMDAGAKKHVSMAPSSTGAGQRKSFRSLLNDSDASFHDSSVGVSAASSVNMNDISYAHPHNMTAGYMNPANPFASPH